MSTIPAKSPGRKNGPKLLIACLVLMLIGTAVMLSGWRQIQDHSPEPSITEGHELSFEDELDAAIAAKRQVDNPDNVIIFGGEDHDAEELRGRYAYAYSRARAEKLMEKPRCEGCGKTEKQLAISGGHLETHHVISVLRIFTEDLDPEMVAHPSNLIVLCRNGKYNCHFTIGHDPDGPDKPLPPNWKESNKSVRRDAAKRLLTLAP